MTIIQRLQSGVLCAPIASVDSRTLSQAWYCALYRYRAATLENDKHPQRSGAVAPRRLQYGAPSREQRAPDFTAPESRRSQRAIETAFNDAKDATHCSHLARKIEIALRRSACGASNASFTLAGKGGRVHVVLRERAGRMYIIALCAPRMRRVVAAALAEARCSLASRGIALATSVRERAA